MKTLALICGMLLALVVGIVVVWQQKYPTYTYRFRLTVEIDTPEGVKSGSSVYEVETHTFPRWLALGNADSSVRIYGGATYIDLGDGKHVFSLIVTPFEWLAPLVILGPDSYIAKLRKERGKIFHNKTSEAVEVPWPLVPPMITFKDIKSPETAELVFGTINEEPIDKSSQVFGEGYALKRVTLQLTHDEPDFDVLQYLPWWNDAGRPASIAWRKVNYVDRLRGSIEPESLFIRIRKR